MEKTERVDIIIEQYKLYIESKDRFVERNFQTNRFFLTFITILIIVMCFIHKSLIYDLSTSQVFAGIGLGASFLWWANAEIYEYLMKAKYNSVIDKIESYLPLQLHAMEKEGLEDIKNQKLKLHLCRITYSEVQKLIAVGSFLVFLVISIREVFPL